ncbi:right-handed parallel beta-helix repeat-containing protein [Burkholderia ubonensis]|uniref:right-handed parallel beta-helix repeat-containing protein n=1 Tax=Burkholderia ubonensis TaxID=101571 RepID=UPI0009B5808E|nr:right-handed parallel beta-helix repeat-containing protein [Burkholderia ubonensis]
MATITLAPRNNGSDQASEIQDAIDRLGSGDTLIFSPGHYAHSRSLTVRADGVTLTGYGAELEATNADDQSVIMSGANATLVGFFLRGTGSTRLTTPDSSKIQITGNGNQVLDNKIDGGASAGIFNFNGNDSVIYRNTVSRTLADGIHITHGAQNVLIHGNTVTGTGDDMIAVVSYADGGLCKNVLVIGNNVSKNVWGRGITVVGGTNVTITGNVVSDIPIGAGILVGQEESYGTFDTSDVKITHNQISNIQMNALDNATRQGGIEIGADKGGRISFIELTDNKIMNSCFEGIRILGEVETVLISRNALENIPPPGTPVTLLQDPGCDPVIIDGSNLLDGVPLVPPPQSIASGPFVITGASSELLPKIRISLMQL